MKGYGLRYIFQWVVVDDAPSWGVSLTFPVGEEGKSMSVMGPSIKEKGGNGHLIYGCQLILFTKSSPIGSIIHEPTKNIRFPNVSSRLIAFFTKQR
jgi:hypothetical protein